MAQTQRGDLIAPALEVRIRAKEPGSPLLDGIREGRNYVSDGKSHLIDFKVNDVVMGVLTVMMPQSRSAVRCGTFWWPRRPQSREIRPGFPDTAGILLGDLPVSWKRRSLQYASRLNGASSV